MLVELLDMDGRLGRDRLNGAAELTQGLKNFGHAQALLAFLRFNAATSRLTGCCA